MRGHGPRLPLSPCAGRARRRTSCRCGRSARLSHPGSAARRGGEPSGDPARACRARHPPPRRRRRSGGRPVVPSRQRPRLPADSARARWQSHPRQCKCRLGRHDGRALNNKGLNLRLLVIEDDPDLNRQLATALTYAGYVVDRAFDGEEGQYLGETEPYDAVILDIGLPKADGISVLENWRRAGRAMPVLILTARDRWSEKVQAFDAGADDYVAKPFHLEEVLARIRALLRRSTGHAKSEFNCGPVRLDTRTGRVSVEGTPIKLTSHEYRLLSYLMHHTGRVVSRTELVEHLYDQDFDRDSNTIEVFVGRIRKKLGVDCIQTVRGLGYLLTPPG